MPATDDLAARLLTARRNRAPFAPRTDDGPTDADQAYAVQWQVTRSLSGGERVAHWKVGAARPTDVPLAAPIPRLCVQPSPARWSEAPVVALSIEAEVAFRVARDIEPASAATVPAAQAFDRALVTIEVCDTRLRGDAPPLWKLADSLSNAGLVVGSGGVAPDAPDYAQLRCAVTVDGEPVFDGRGSHPLGDPRVLLPWFIAHASRHAPLRAGDIVTTGSWCGMVPVHAGAVVAVQFEGVGSAELRVAG